MSEKLYLEAIRALPEMWIRSGTFVNINGGKAYAANKEFVPIVYDGKWKEIVLSNPSPPRKNKAECCYVCRWYDNGRCGLSSLRMGVSKDFWCKEFMLLPTLEPRKKLIEPIEWRVEMPCRREVVVKLNELIARVNENG